MVEAEHAGGLDRLQALYIDDDDLNLRVVAELLRSVGAAVTCCRRPREALEILAQRPFDVALIDIHMPEMSGIELLNELRRTIGPNRAMPTLALTADLTRAAHQYRDLGFDGFVAKPVSLKELLSSILVVLTATAEAKALGRRLSPLLRRTA
jgi:CheY-like chemotaxis protein